MNDVPLKIIDAFRDVRVVAGEVESVIPPAFSSIKSGFPDYDWSPTEDGKDIFLDMTNLEL